MIRIGALGFDGGGFCGWSRKIPRKRPFMRAGSGFFVQREAAFDMEAALRNKSDFNREMNKAHTIKPRQ